MVFLKFQDSKALVKCEVIPNSNNIVTLKFEDAVIVDTSGFSLYLDANEEYGISGDTYKDFKTIYRNDEATAKYNGYQLSNDGSVYEENEVSEVQELPVHELTDEERAALEKSQKKATINAEINDYKTELEKTDYIFTKCYEMSLVGEENTEYDFEELHKERQALRDKINELEKQLAEMEE